MAVGNKPLKKKESIANPKTLNCICCNTKLDIKEFYDSDSGLYGAFCKIPYCKECLNKLYQNYYEKYKRLEYSSPERKAIERMCMVLDLYYSDKIFNSVMDQFENGKFAGVPIMYLYVKNVKMYQYRNKNYDTTIHEKYKEAKDRDSVFSIYDKDDSQKSEEVALGENLFGSGFSNDDYVFLYREYCDWTTRHECQTKSQEELFKQICHARLNLLKAERAGQDTKDLMTTFLKALEAAKLQPKQNVGDAMSDAQTFGTLIDKWENTRPIPEVDDELKDVDKIGLYIDVFFRGHLSKMMGLKNGLSNIYDQFIKKYTVEKTEYDADEDNDALFEAIFGRDLEDEALSNGKEK